MLAHFLDYRTFGLWTHNLTGTFILGSRQSTLHYAKTWYSLQSHKIWRL